MKALLLVGIVGSIASADIFIVSKQGTWRMVNGVPTQQQSFTGHRVIFDIDGGGDTDPDDDKDPDDDVATKIAAITKGTINPGMERIALVAAVRILTRPDVDLKQAKPALAAAINALSVNALFPGNKFSAWLDQVNALHTGDYTREFIAAIAKGVNVDNLPAGTSLTMLRLLQGTSSAAEKINIVQLIQLIQLLIELFEKFGLFKPKEVRYKVPPLGYIGTWPEKVAMVKGLGR